jgi:DNA adenine methylase
MIIPTFLKWAGGKRRIISQIDPYIPRKINTYYEPFLGGASMFFYIRQKYNPKKCVLSDINFDLVETFKAVRDNPHELIKKLKYFKRKHSSDFFYNTRERFNTNKFVGIRRSAAFIYLNKTCFNGLYRVNSKNEFNVPFGKYINPEIFNEQTILFASELLQGVEIIRQDYRGILDSVKKGDFVYLDPCYDPIKRTSFANYTPIRFCEQDRLNLYKFMYLLKSHQVSVILSNNDLPVIRKLYIEFLIHLVQAPRSINSISSNRGLINEIIIMANVRRSNQNALYC